MATPGHDTPNLTLITKVQITKAMTLDLSRVRRVIENSGYGDAEDIRSSKFLGCNDTGAFVYEIVYNNPNGPGLETGMIYLKYARTPESDYQLTAEY